MQILTKWLVIKFLVVKSSLHMTEKLTMKLPHVLLTLPSLKKTTKKKPKKTLTNYSPCMPLQVDKNKRERKVEYLVHSISGVKLSVIHDNYDQEGQGK